LYILTSDINFGEIKRLVFVVDKVMKLGKEPVEESLTSIILV
jgi:hypothetical protein